MKSVWSMQLRAFDKKVRVAPNALPLSTDSFEFHCHN